MYAIQSRYPNLAIIRALLEADANPNIQGMSGFTALVMTDSVGMMELLLEHAADPKATNI